MGDPNIDEAMRKSGVRMGDYCGTSAVAAHGDTNANFLALRDGCGIVGLTWRKRLRIAGEDRVRWLNGMVTNNIRDLAPGHGVYAFLLNPQGKIQADMYCFNRGDDLLIETDASQFDNLRTVLDKYIIMDDVELADAEMLTKLLVAGPKSAEVLRRALGSQSEAALAAAPLQMTALDPDGAPIAVIRGDDPVLSFESWVATGAAAKLWKALADAGAAPVGYEAFEMLRIWSGRPRFGHDIRERDLPQETGQDRALSFTKGCYVGQEIVERIRSRGAVHRIFAGFAFESGPPQPGEKIMVDGKEAGEITSAATLPGDEGPPRVGLGYIRREFSKPETIIQAGSITGRVATPPFEYVKANT